MTVSHALTLVCLFALTASEPASDQLELDAEWGPIATSTYRLEQQFQTVAEVMGAGPATPRASHDFDALRALLPIGATALGDVWKFDVGRVLPFQAQLHPGVTKDLRHQGPAVEGGRATLLRASASELEVLLRVHVEFELLPGRMWLLPAQFEGHLVWDCEHYRPKSFHLALPSRDTNYDLNYRVDGMGTVDIGHLPLMQVASAGTTAAEGPEADAARKRLRASFYPSDRIQWHDSLADALIAAQDSGRRLHVMQLFGTLDDESC